MASDSIPAVIGDDAAATAVLPITRPPFSEHQNRFLQYFVTVSTAPSWLASALILFVLWKERRVRLKKPANTYHRLILGLSWYDFVWSLHFAFFGGHWTIPRFASDWVWGADASTDVWCNISGVLFYHYLGTVLYSTCLMLYFVMDLHWDWPKEWIAEHLEPWMHGVSNAVPWLHGLIAWLSESIVPSPKLPGVCYLREWPPDCETDRNPDPCIQGNAQGTIVSAALTTGVFGVWMVVIAAAMTTLTRQVWRVEHKLRLQQQARSLGGGSASFTRRASQRTRRSNINSSSTTSGSSRRSEEELPLTRRAAVQGLLYVLTGLVCTLPAVPFNFSFWDLNEEYRQTHFIVAMLICCLTGNQGVFNAIIYLRPYFRELTLSSNSTLWFLRPVRQVLEKSSCCVAFWSCKCCDCFVQTALESTFFRPSMRGSSSSNFAIALARPPPRFAPFTSSVPAESHQIPEEDEEQQLKAEQPQQQQQQGPPPVPISSLTRSHSQSGGEIPFVPIASSGNVPLSVIPERQHGPLNTVSSVSMNTLEETRPHYVSKHEKHHSLPISSITFSINADVTGVVPNPKQWRSSSSHMANHSSPNHFAFVAPAKTDGDIVHSLPRVSSLTTTSGGDVVIVAPPTTRNGSSTSSALARNTHSALAHISSLTSATGLKSEEVEQLPTTPLPQRSHVKGNGQQQQDEDEETGIQRPRSAARTKNKRDLNVSSLYSDVTPSTSGTLHQEEEIDLSAKLFVPTRGRTRTPQQLATLPSDEEEITGQDDDGWVQAPIFVREGCLHETIVAPAGSLRVCIRPTADGPLIWAVDKHSPIRECIEVGDVLIAIDNISTRWMAIENVVALIVATRVLARRITVERHETAVMDRQDFEVVFECDDDDDNDDDDVEEDFEFHKRPQSVLFNSAVGRTPAQ